MMLSPRSYLFTRKNPSQETSKASTTTSSKPEKTPSTMRRKSSTSTSARSHPRDKASSLPQTPTKATSSEPVVIPVRGYRDGQHSSRHGTHTEAAREHAHKSGSIRRARNVHSPDAIPPAVAALLAMTTIPPPKSQTYGGTKRRQSHQQKLAVDEILFQNGESEKELSMALGRSPLDVLLSPPDEDDLETLCSASESIQDSDILHSTMSCDSIPSLDNSLSSPSLASVRTPSLRGRKSLPTRRLESLSSDLTSSSSSDHPLSMAELEFENQALMSFQIPSRKDVSKVTNGASPVTQSAFKSNLTASLRALKSAARTITNLKPPLMTPDDFLTRSIIYPIDSPMSFSDDRMPPLLEDVPTPALRRYLNPTTNAPIDAHVPSAAYPAVQSKVSASIQMRTYRISRSGKSSVGSAVSVISKRTVATAIEEVAEVATGPVARQRDVRENSDFIRIAVMEMAMRRNGKLDEKLPGRAKWCLPPRKPATKPYEITPAGVPVRWIGVTA